MNELFGVLGEVAVGSGSQLAQGLGPSEVTTSLSESATALEPSLSLLGDNVRPKKRTCQGPSQFTSSERSDGQDGSGTKGRSTKQLVSRWSSTRCFTSYPSYLPLLLPTTPPTTPVSFAIQSSTPHHRCHEAQHFLELSLALGRSDEPRRRFARCWTNCESREPLLRSYKPPRWQSADLLHVLPMPPAGTNRNCSLARWEASWIWRWTCRLQALHLS